MTIQNMRRILSGILACTMLASMAVTTFAEKIGSYDYVQNAHPNQMGALVTCSYTGGNGYGASGFPTESQGTAPVLEEQVKGLPVVCMRSLYDVSRYSSYKGISVAPVIPKYMKDMYAAFRATSISTPPAIPDGVENLDYAFTGCKYLSTFPQLKNTSITTMTSAFANSPNAAGTTELPATVINLSNAFSNCAKLSSFPALSHLDGLTDANNAFSGCASTTGGTRLPESGSLTNIMSMFRNCAGMTEAPPVIPKGVENMSYAFEGCTRMSGTIDLRAVPTQYTNAFSGAASVDGAKLTLNYTEEHEQIVDAIIASKKYSDLVVQVIDCNAKYFRKSF